jgi:hypothetical protein
VKYSLLILFLTFSAHATDLPEWTFDSPDSGKAWVPNQHLENVMVEDGVLKADAADWDPIFVCRDLSIPATPWQYVLLRVRANRSGDGALFWAGTYEGKYGGFEEKKKTPFQIVGDGEWKEICIFPFWQAEREILQLRLDVYEGTHFEIDSIQVREWGAGSSPISDTFCWEFEGDLSSWQVHSEAKEIFAPPMHLPIEDKAWVTVRLRSQIGGSASLLWAIENELGILSEDFRIRDDGQFHSYNLEMDGIPTWRNDLVALGLRLPSTDRNVVFVESIRISDQPSGPPEIDVDCFGFENGVNRAGVPCSVIAQIANRGGSSSESTKVILGLPPSLRLEKGQPERVIGRLDFQARETVTWNLVADFPGTHLVKISAEDHRALPPMETHLSFEPPLNHPRADYVPEPQPIETDIDVCMYYFPGWNSDAKWDCVRVTAPIRKPLLGYYDESHPECVDWQIKWAVENGITCFLVDWYWIKGSQHLAHWFEAYRNSRYRDYLKVAIMWANHNPPGSHSAEDFERVTQHWIEDYFPMESYYRIEGKPAVFLWDPSLIRMDLGGVETVRETLNRSKKAAAEAGYSGITFVAMHHHDSTSEIRDLLEEGYTGATNYHEWGNAFSMGESPKLAQFEDLVKSVPETWEKRDEACGELTYYPVVDSGWDSRPWHGNSAQVIEGRTPDLFEDLLREAKAFCEKKDKTLVILGPANEWGEGSYVEPCTEFGFEMYERIREVFAKGDPKIWPQNLSPADVGLGPYDFPKRPLVTAWDFEDGPGGWERSMNVAAMRCEDGQLRFQSASGDPAILVDTPGLEASKFPRMVIRMSATPNAGSAQLFWSRSGHGTTEAASLRFPLQADGTMHDYALNLAENPRWRGNISTFRFDPCDAPDVEISIEEIRLAPASEPHANRLP